MLDYGNYSRKLLKRKKTTQGKYARKYIRDFITLMLPKLLLLRLWCSHALTSEDYIKPVRSFGVDCCGIVKVFAILTHVDLYPDPVSCMSGTTMMGSHLLR
jgi:hypothetical protein